MIYEINISVLPGEETNEARIREQALRKLAEKGTVINPAEITAFVFRKKSIDARHGQIKLHLRYSLYVGEQPDAQNDAASGQFKPAWRNANQAKKVIIIGCGPAGLFAALQLLEYGITPVILERGPETAQRKIDIADISRTHSVNADSNYCFGEGGAGTFSDGKLYSRSNKRGNIGRILAILNHFGADNTILTDAHPHIGTDRLPAVINAMTAAIRSFGGSIFYNTRCESLIIKNGTVCGVTAVTCTGEAAGTQQFEGAAVILAAGHSAADIYTMLAEQEAALKPAVPVLEAKTFAMGVRVEHPRTVIDTIQYHGTERGTALPAAEYRLTAQIEERGVYSFCMCPGGLVVPSASGNDGIVINGMSPSSRNTRWSNAAIVVETRPEDIPAQFGTDALAGLRYRTWIEQTAQKESGVCQKAPAQRLSDFLAGKKSASLPESSYTPGLVSSRLDEWLPEPIAERLAQAFRAYDRNMHGFICPEAVLIAPETRTSTPVRILRNQDTLESAALPGLFPAGEGSGYAGGIVSSAMDGEKAALSVCKNCFQITGDTAC